MTLPAPYTITLKKGSEAFDLTESLLELTELTRKTEREGRRPGILYFDNVNIEIPYQPYAAIFSRAALAEYPRLVVEIKLGNRSLFKGIVDIESVRYTGAVTVSFTVLNILSSIDRVRFPAAWERWELVSAWNESFTTGSVNQVQFVPQERVGGTSFYNKLFIQPLPTWNTQIPFRSGDFLIHPEFPAFFYQIINAKIIRTGNAFFYELTLDRDYFDPNYVPGQSGPIYNSVDMRKRELLQRDIYEFAFNPDWDVVFTFEPKSVNGKALGEAIFSDIDLWPVSDDFLGQLPLTLATVIASIDSPVDILLRVVYAAGKLLYVNRSGEVASKAITQLYAPVTDTLPGYDPEGVLNAESLFAWDKRVDVVKVRSNWRGQTDEVELEAIEALSEASRRNELSIEVVAPPEDLEDIALDLLRLYGVRREQLKFAAPLAQALEPSTDYPALEQIADLDLFDRISLPFLQFEGPGWVSELRISLQSLQADITLTSIEGFLPEGATNPDLLP